MKARKNCCPVCGGTLLCRENDEIICLALPCSWRTASKRGEDINLPVFDELREMFNE